MRLTFIAHFILCLACLGALFFAWSAGVPQFIYSTDVSMMTSVIAALFVGTTAWMGWQAWLADEPPTYLGLDARGMRIDGRPPVSAKWGAYAAELSLILGVIGMALGLAMQGKTIGAGGTAIFAAWATQLYATIAGCVACGIIILMTFNLESGLERR